MEYDENRIYDDSPPSKGRLEDVALEFSREAAEKRADAWRKDGFSARVHPRRIKVDSVSYPVFMVIVRHKKGAIP